MSKFGAYLSKADLVRMGIGDLGCPCRRGMGDLGCDGCAGDCQGKGFGDLAGVPRSPVYNPMGLPTSLQASSGGYSYLTTGFGDLGLTPTDPLSQIPALKPIQAQVEKASALISPWLWVFSVVGFGLAALNTSRINAMWSRYGGSKFKGLTKPKL